ncbi:MAG: NADH-quinone oxidoreductase subunit H [Spirochaetes bacterium]|nr:MAG: NADH-quinone oxidoreductase subunit H [Spirochaetota bacterium]
MNTVLWIIFYPLIAFCIGILYMGYSRKFNARVERRYGPSWIQPIYDIFKLMSKRTNISHGWMHDISILMLLGGTILTLMFIPVPGFSFFSQYGDMLVIMYIILIPSLGMALGVGETANPNGSIGISRALMMLAGYDVPFALSFIGMGMLNHTTSMFRLIQIQQAHGIASWGIVTNPLLGLAALIALQGMMGEKPFEVYIAPHEIATGPMTEMGGKFLGMMFITHAITIFVELTIFINLFLGGAVTWIDLILKQVVVFTLILSVNIVFGRFRVDDAMRFMWKIPGSLAVLGILFIIF